MVVQAEDNTIAYELNTDTVSLEDYMPRSIMSGSKERVSDYHL